MPRRLDTASQRVGHGPLQGLLASGGNASDLNSRSTSFESRTGLKSKFILAFILHKFRDDTLNYATTIPFYIHSNSLSSSHLEL